jgi:uncharacterized protein YbaP (TraB family)
MNRKILVTLIAPLFFAAPATADDALVEAHPVAWHIHTGHSEITLFGSVHMLPANMDWLTPDVVHSISRSEVFVFEVPTDMRARASLNAMIDTEGTLPAGQSLRAELPPASQADFDAAITAEHLSASVTDREQPWLASLQLTLADTMNRNYYPDAGVDYVVMNWAMSHRRQMRYLETVDQQLAMLMPDQTERGAQLDQFETALKQVGQEDRDLDSMVQAWSDGDVAKLDGLVDADFADHPDNKKRLLADRNRNWASQIEQMAGEWHNFFIVVGAAHLVGPDGVPALLRKDGLQVDGP